MYCLVDRNDEVQFPNDDGKLRKGNRNSIANYRNWLCDRNSSTAVPGSWACSSQLYQRLHWKKNFPDLDPGFSFTCTNRMVRWPRGRLVLGNRSHCHDKLHFGNFHRQIVTVHSVGECKVFSPRDLLMENGCACHQLLVQDHCCSLVRTKLAGVRGTSLRFRRGTEVLVSIKSQRSGICALGATPKLSASDLCRSRQCEGKCKCPGRLLKMQLHFTL